METKRLSIVCRCAAMLLAAASATAALATESLESEARRTGKGVMILQVGSGWCVASERVRQVFESDEFRKDFKDRYVFGVYDAMENLAPEVNAENARVKSLLIYATFFPALTCYSPEMKVFSEVKNISGDATADMLVKRVKRAENNLAEAQRCFTEASSAPDKEALALYGKGFETLLEQRSSTREMSFGFKAMTEGEHGWREEWNRLVALDKGSQFGWEQCLRLDNSFSVGLVGGFMRRKAASRKDAEAYLKEFESLPSRSIMKRQLEAILKYALSMEGLDKPLTPKEKLHLQSAVELCAGSFWGQFAQGRLLAEGKNIKPKEDGVSLASRDNAPAASKKVSFPLDKTAKRIKDIKPGAELTERQKLDISRYAALRLIGKSGWDKLTARRGSDKFVRAFLGDRTWLEDFAWNGRFPKTSNHREEGDGPGAAEGAILALESLVFQDIDRLDKNAKQWVAYDKAKNRYVDNEGRRFMTALAMNYPDKSEAWLADVLCSYGFAAQHGSLHKDAYTQPVWCWRMALQQGYSSPFFADDLALQQVCLNRYAKMPSREYSKLLGMMPFTPYHCFGGPLRQLTPIISNVSTSKMWFASFFGGTAPDRSNFAAACINAQGIPATTVRQPQGHRAFAHRKPNGSWALEYSVGAADSKTHCCFWPLEDFKYLQLMEETLGVDRETRHAADRMVTLAELSEESGAKVDTVVKYYQAASKSHPKNLSVWLKYGAYLRRAGSPPDQMSAWKKAFDKVYSGLDAKQMLDEYVPKPS